MPGGVLWSPRVGFNYALSGNGREQIRGGVGLFSGRTPYVWLSNQYGNTGIEFRRLTVGVQRRQRGFRSSPIRPRSRRRSAAPRPTKSTSSIPDYKYPSLAPRPTSPTTASWASSGSIGTDRVPLLAERQRHRVPEPEPACRPARGRTAGRSTRATASRGSQRRDPPDQHRPGRCVEHGVQGRSAVPQPAVHERVVPLRRVDVDSRRHQLAGGVELGQHLHLD